MGLKQHALSLVASIIFHTCIRSRIDWTCCQSEKSDKTDSTAACATVKKPVSKLFRDFENPNVSGCRILVILSESFLRV